MNNTCATMLCDGCWCSRVTLITSLLLNCCHKGWAFAFLAIILKQNRPKWNGSLCSYVPLHCKSNISHQDWNTKMALFGIFPWRHSCLWTKEAGKNKVVLYFLRGQLLIPYWLFVSKILIMISTHRILRLGLWNRIKFSVTNQLKWLATQWVYILEWSSILLKIAAKNNKQIRNSSKGKMPCLVFSCLPGWEFLTYWSQHA